MAEGEQQLKEEEQEEEEEDPPEEIGCYEITIYRSVSTRGLAKSYSVFTRSPKGVLSHKYANA